jgi:hypothetical protein
VRFEPLGEATLERLNRPVPLFRVLRVSADASSDVHRACAAHPSRSAPNVPKGVDQAPRPAARPDSSPQVTRWPWGNGARLTLDYLPGNDVQPCSLGQMS